MSRPFAFYSNAALRELEQRAQRVAGMDEDTLMRRAGQAAWQQLLHMWPQAHRITVLCGPGNNGGDGWVLAAHALESGRDVRVVRLGDGAPRTALARVMAAAYHHAGGGEDAFDGVLPEADVLVDALFGIGCDRALSGDAAALVEAANASGIPVLALDVPSGVDADTGRVPGPAIRAAHTLQFIAAHAGLATGAALDHVGVASVAGLDLPGACFDGVTPAAQALRRPSLPRRRRDSHKGRHGHVLAIGGDHGMGGAIILAGEAALRTGAGLASVATRAEQAAALLVRRPEVMAHALEDTSGLSPLLARADALALGPGLGQAQWGRGLFDAAIASGKPCVIDADALNLLAAAPRPLPFAVLTPHPGEAARLLGIDTAAVQADRLSAARALSTRFDCAVVLKGAGSLVAAPGQVSGVALIGNPGMATGGMGDALTGVIATLLAQGRAPFDAAAIGTWLHARAGDRAAKGGEAGLLASDLIAQLPATLAECTA